MTYCKIASCDVESLFLFPSASRADNFMLAAYPTVCKCIDLDRQVFATPWGHDLHISEIEKTVPLELTLVRHGIATKLKRLCLSREEEAVIRALAVMSPGEL